jgi:hypothetical protein
MWEWLDDGEQARRTAVLGEVLARKSWPKTGGDIFIGTGASLTTVWCPGYAYMELTGSPEQARLARLEEISKYWGMHIIQEDPTTPPEVLEREAIREDYEENLLRLARNIALPPEGFVALSTKRQMRVREQVASNPWCPDTVLLAFARGDSKALSARAAGSIGLPLSEFPHLAEQGAPRAKATLAANPMTPTELVAQACVSRSKDVRQGAATNMMLSAELCYRLSGDSNTDVRRAVAANPATPEDVLVSMTRDSEAVVRADVASQRRLPEGILEALCRDDDVMVRRSVAGNLSTPREGLVTLATDEAAYVRCVVAGNLSTPASALSVLSLDHDVSVRRAVHDNASAPEDARAQAALAGIW